MSLEIQFHRNPHQKNHVFVSAKDVTSQELEKEFLKFHDRNTLLANKAALKARLTQVLRTYSERTSGALLLLHINGLRRVNMLAGAIVGDELVRRLSDGLKEEQESGRGLVYRIWDGAQFAFLIENISGVDGVLEVARDILRRLPQTFTLPDGRDIDISYSVGITTFCGTDRSLDPEDIIHQAEYTLRTSKDSVKNTIEFYNTVEHDRYLKRLDRIALISDSLRYGRIVPWFQPVGEVGWMAPRKDALRILLGPDATDASRQPFRALMRLELFDDPDSDPLVVRKGVANLREYLTALGTIGVLTPAQANLLFDQFVVNPFVREIIGFEALMRIRSRDGRIVNPGEFLPVAEEASLITDCEWAMLPLVLDSARGWMSRDPDIKVSVNFSMKTLGQDAFPRTLLEFLGGKNMDAERFSIEFVERDSLHEMHSDAISRYRELTDRGIGFYIDDFGEGTNSVYRISLMHEIISTIKISTTFVRSLEDSATSEHAVQALAATGRIFHKNVIAEGVEAFNGLRRISQLGPSQIQGYGLARPMPATDVAAFLSEFKNKKGLDRFAFPVSNPKP